LTSITGGRFAPGNTTARKGGAARAGYRMQARALGMARLPDGAVLAPYRKYAREWRDATAADIAATVGGGTLGPLVGSLLDSSALSLMWSRYLSDTAMTSCDPATALMASKHAEVSSRLVREAREYAALDAKAREDGGDGGLAAERAAFQKRLAEGGS
jgi:hypothetical protein